MGCASSIDPVPKQEPPWTQSVRVIDRPTAPEPIAILDPILLAKMITQAELARNREALARAEELKEAYIVQELPWAKEFFVNQIFPVAIQEQMKDHPSPYYTVLGTFKFPPSTVKFSPGPFTLHRIHAMVRYLKSRTDIRTYTFVDVPCEYVNPTSCRLSFTFYIGNPPD